MRVAVSSQRVSSVRRTFAPPSIDVLEPSPLIPYNDNDRPLSTGSNSYDQDDVHLLADFEPLDVDVNEDVVDGPPSAEELLRQLEEEQQQQPFEDEDDFYGTGS